jgi:hypothetical protein
MNENLRSRNGSNVYAQITAAKLSDSDRASALAALARAEMLVDAAAWLSRKLGQIGAHLFLKPGVKH